MRLALPFLAVLALAACGDGQDVVLTGDRVPLRDGTFANGVLRGEARGIALPAARANADWTHRGGGPAHDRGHVALGGSLAPLFSVGIGEGDSRGARITAEPVVAGGRVFTLDARATVSAFSTGGQLLWTRSVVPAGTERSDASGGGVSTDGATLYVSTGYGRLVALDAATGEPRWSQDLDAPGSSSPTILGDLILLVARDSRAFALEAATGRIRWQVQGLPSTATFAGGAGVAARGDLVVLPHPSGEVRGVFPQGGIVRWTTVIAGNRLGSAAAFAATDIGGDPVLVGDRLFVGNVSGRTAALRADTGETIWSIAEGAVAPVAVAGDSAFLLNDLGQLLRLDASNGAVIWRLALPQAGPRRGVTAFYGPILAGGRLIVGSSDNGLLQVDPASGALLRSVPLPAGAASAPVVAGQTLYVITEDGRLNAFR